MMRTPALILTTALIWLSSSISAYADTEYNPDNYNGKVIYLSRACHDSSDGIPGGSCIPNYGCVAGGTGQLNENTNSRETAQAVTYGDSIGANLLDRGYAVVIGNGTVSENIANSNARPHVRLHIPIHSNASGNDNCVPRGESQHGTHMLYRYAGQESCGRKFLDWVGFDGPGTDDDLKYRTGLGELNSVSSTTCYLEAEFHDVNRGVVWLRDRDVWSWKFGAAVDTHLGYP